MGIAPDEDPPPISTDLEGWRCAVNEGHLGRFRLEEIVAAIQDLGPCADSAVLNPLAKHLSDALLRILHGLVSVQHRNRGRDIIERTHGQIVEAVLRPTCADGKALRIAFVPRVKFRLKDALAFEARAARKPREPTKRNSGPDGGPDVEQTPSGNSPPAATHFDPSCAIDEYIDVDNVLEQVTDDRKRLAFRLYMDGVPFKSKELYSIASALGISERTARQWVNEVKGFLSSIPEVQEFLKSKTRGMP